MKFLKILSALTFALTIQRSFLFGAQKRNIQDAPEIIVLKLGGSVITQKNNDRAKINIKILKQIAQEIGQALQAKYIKLVIVHGTGPFGHVPAKKYIMPHRRDPEKLAEGLSFVELSLQDLSCCVVKQLVESKINAVSFSPFAAGIFRQGIIDAFNIEALKKMLDQGLVPVLHGDCVMDITNGFALAGSDFLTVYLAKELKASRVIMAMDHNGVFTGNPANATSKKIDVMTKDQLIILDNAKPKGTDVTGGIKKKVEELLILSPVGIEAEIISGKRKEYVKRALLGQRGLGTIVR